MKASQVERADWGVQKEQLVQEQAAMSQAEQRGAEMKVGRKPLEQLRQRVQRQVQLWLLLPPLQPSSLPAGPFLLFSWVIYMVAMWSTDKQHAETRSQTGLEQQLMDRSSY